MIEATLFAPWLLFLSIGVLDVGFYTYTMIAVENATRVAAEYCSQNVTKAADTTRACALVTADLASLPRTGRMVSCSAAQVTGPDNALATQVTVTYSVNAIPLPAVLPGAFTFTRSTKMRLAEQL